MGNLPASRAFSRATALRFKLLTLRKTRTENTGNLLDQDLRGQESVVLLRELFDELLVLVES